MNKKEKEPPFDSSIINKNAVFFLNITSFLQVVVSCLSEIRASISVTGKFIENYII